MSSDLIPARTQKPGPVQNVLSQHKHEPRQVFLTNHTTCASTQAQTSEFPPRNLAEGRKRHQPERRAQQHGAEEKEEAVWRCLIIETHTSISLTLDASLRTPVQCWGKDGRGHNLLSNHDLINGRFMYPPEHSELKGEAGYSFHWQKN